jgi:hypothetical protein
MNKLNGGTVLTGETGVFGENPIPVPLGSHMSHTGWAGIEAVSPC